MTNIDWSYHKWHFLIILILLFSWKRFEKTNCWLLCNCSQHWGNIRPPFKVHVSYSLARWDVSMTFDLLPTHFSVYFNFVASFIGIAPKETEFPKLWQNMIQIWRLKSHFWKLLEIKMELTSNWLISLMNLFVWSTTSQIGPNMKATLGGWMWNMQALFLPQ